MVKILTGSAAPAMVIEILLEGFALVEEEEEADGKTSGESPSENRIPIPPNTTTKSSVDTIFQSKSATNSDRRREHGSNSGDRAIFPNTRPSFKPAVQYARTPPLSKHNRQPFLPPAQQAATRQVDVQIFTNPLPLPLSRLFQTHTNQRPFNFTHAKITPQHHHSPSTRKLTFPTSLDAPTSHLLAYFQTLLCNLIPIPHQQFLSSYLNHLTLLSTISPTPLSILNISEQLTPILLQSCAPYRDACIEALIRGIRRRCLVRERERERGIESRGGEVKRFRNRWGTGTGKERGRERSLNQQTRKGGGVNCACKKGVDESDDTVEERGPDMDVDVDEEKGHQEGEEEEEEEEEELFHWALREWIGIIEGMWEDVLKHHHHERK